MQSPEDRLLAPSSSWYALSLKNRVHMLKRTLRGLHASSTKHRKVGEAGKEACACQRGLQAPELLGGFFLTGSSSVVVGGALEAINHRMFSGRDRIPTGCGKRIFRNLLPHSNLSQRKRSKGKQPSFIQGAELRDFGGPQNSFFPHPAKDDRITISRGGGGNATGLRALRDGAPHWQESTKSNVHQDVCVSRSDPAPGLIARFGCGRPPCLRLDNG